MESISALSPVFEEMLQSGRTVTFLPDGVSMRPMLQPRRGKVVIEKLDRPVRKYDIALYKRADGQLVLHRVVRRRGEMLTMCGDGQVTFEPGIHVSQVLGVLKGYYLGGRYIEPTGFKYALYCRTLWLRRLKRRVFRMLRKR